MTDDAIWKALADSTRREILDALRDEPKTTGDLVDRFDTLCRTAVMKHLDLLVKAGLIVVRREGRFRWNHINPAPLQLIYERWMAPHMREPAARATRLKRFAEQLEAESKPTRKETKDSETAGSKTTREKRGKDKQ